MTYHPSRRLIWRQKPPKGLIRLILPLAMALIWLSFSEIVTRPRPPKPQPEWGSQLAEAWA
jgi:hypothetical protein